MNLSLKVFQEKYKSLDISLRDKVRYEQVGNTIYLMSVPTRVHEAIVQQVQKQMGNYFDGLDSSCRVYGSNSGLNWSERIDFLKGFEEFEEYFSEKGANNLFLLPDIQVICDNREELWTSNGYKGVPSLVVEVWSPSTGENDLTFKKSVYERVGISEYWVILDIRNVLVYTLINGKYVKKRYTLDGDFFFEGDGDKDILEVSSLIFSDLVIRLDKKYIL